MPEAQQASNGAPAKTPARTIAQITKELDQTASEITSLDLQVQSRRDRFQELAQELAEVQSETFARFGMRVVIENERTGYPVADRHQARVARFAQRQAPAPARQTNEEGPTRREMKEWATRTNWTFNTKSAVAKGRNKPEQFDKRLPVDMEEALERDYLAAKEAMNQS